MAAEEITEANLALVALFRPFRELGDHAVTLDRTVGVVTKAVFEALAIPAPQGEDTTTGKGVVPATIARNVHADSGAGFGGICRHTGDFKGLAGRGAGCGSRREYCAQCGLPDLKTTANKKTCSVACKSKFHRNGVQ